MPPPGETVILEHEIEYVIFGSCSDRRGIWRKKKVGKGNLLILATPSATHYQYTTIDVLYGWSYNDLKAVKDSLRGYKALQAKGLTNLVYDMCGCIVGQDGSVVALVSEAASGRMIRPSDKFLIFDTIARLQSMGFLYRGCGTNRFMIQDNTVRLLEWNCIIPYKNREKLNRTAEKWHWDELEDLFNQVEESGGRGDLISLPSRFTTSWRDTSYLFPKTSPERPFGIRIHAKFLSNYFLRPEENRFLLERLDAIKHRRLSYPQNNRFRLASDDYDKADYPDISTTKVGKIRGPPVSIRNSRNQIMAPYDRRYHRRRTVGTPDASDTLSTGSSTTFVTQLSSGTLDSMDSFETLVTEETPQVDHATANIFTASKELFDDEIISTIVSPALSSDQHSSDYVDDFFTMVDEGEPSKLFGLSDHYESQGILWHLL